ncbi:hypothetical protein F511_11271 [Dorcoceras hygrometricum]|uniref:Uncharacterized protein n=1 Tax=Dorcoceras hygrometricum TaxID=472368 RepID=A0A2Z7CD21_9LAMI|nr:hypothetical protein F511_11271 [Dorcoceras hygrometricum]
MDDELRIECCASAEQKTEKCTTHSSACRKLAHFVTAGVQADSVLRLVSERFCDLVPHVTGPTIRDSHASDEQLQKWRLRDEEKGNGLYTVDDGIVKFRVRFWVPSSDALKRTIL